MPLRLPQRRRYKTTAEGTDDMVGKKIAEKIIQAHLKSTCEDLKKLRTVLIDEISVQAAGTPKERYIAPEI